jgi:hypothetical protein
LTNLINLSNNTTNSKIRRIVYSITKLKVLKITCRINLVRVLKYKTKCSKNKKTWKRRKRILSFKSKI